MKRPLFSTLAFTLALALCAALLPLSVPDAFAADLEIDSSVSGNVYGNSDDGTGTNYDGSPTGNSVTVENGGTVDGSVWGGYALGGTSASASDNVVTVENGGTVGSTVVGGAANSIDSASVTASGNVVTVKGEVTNLNVFGGTADGSDSGSVAATGNVVIVSGKVGMNVYGGESSSTGSGSSTATGNSVIVDGGTVAFEVYGSRAVNSTGAGTATENSVTINGGSVGLNVYGGYASGQRAPGTAINNRVTITGSTVFGPRSILYGGYIDGTGDGFTGNTLNLHSPITVYGVENFQNLNFYLPTSFVAGDTMLTVTGTAQLTENSDGTDRSSIVNVGIDGGVSPLLEGDQVVLIDAGTLVTNSDLNTTADGQGMQGVTLRYQFAIEALNNQLLATVTGVGANEQAKALSEGFAGAMALTMQGADLAAGTGMANAVSAAGASGSGSGFGSFGGLSGGSLRYNSGSHVDMNSVSLMAGLAWGVDTTPGRLTLGAFFEYGNGSYDTHNSFSNSASVNGDGDTYYTGGGVLGRMDFTPTGPGRFYTEASARMGKAHNEYSSSDLQFNGIDAEYDSSSLYYGFHLGTGYIWNITEAASLDLYGKYFWTRQEGDSVTLSTSDPVTFKGADSSRLRFGTRFAYAVNEYVAPYVGAAYEHEFDGKARATTNGFGIDAPSLKGDTGIGEIGLTLKPATTLPLSFDLGLQGYTGVREGVTGSLQVKLEF